MSLPLLAGERAVAQQLRTSATKLSPALISTRASSTLGLTAATPARFFSSRPTRAAPVARLAPAIIPRATMAYSTASSTTPADPREKDLSIPNKAVQAVFDKNGGPCRMVEYDPSKIELKNGECLVRITYTGVCHTDLHAMLGDWPLPTKVQATGEPLVGGHEGAGVVVKMGEGSSSHVALGDRVGIKWVASACLNCDYCRVGHESTCTDLQNSGYHVDGTFQQYVVTPANYVTPIPDELSLRDAAPILCAGVTIYRALLEANLQPGQWVVMPGAGGGLGHLGVQYARAFGYRVVAIDTGEAKRKMTAELGADAWLDFKTCPDLVGEVKRITGGLGAHAALVAAASPQAYSQGLQMIRPRGTLVSIGMPPGTNIEADVFDTTVSAKKIVGSIVGNRQDAIEALRLCAQGKVRCIYQEMGLTELNKVYEAMQNGTLAGRVVLNVDH